MRHGNAEPGDVARGGADSTRRDIIEPGHVGGSDEERTSLVL